jgi:hypothetical protein
MSTKLLCVVFAGAALATAQTKVFVNAPGAAAQTATATFISVTDAGKVVTGSPYSADIITETSRTLADGTKIARKDTARIWRDSQGRTRREQSFAMIGPWANSGEKPPVVITITDPVAGESYMLNSADKSARKTKLPEGGAASLSGANVGFVTMSSSAKGEGDRTMASETLHVERFVRRMKEDGESKTESLGRQTMEGVAVDGTRTTHTIPAGEIGNDRPITTTTESWYSPDLQTTVYRKTTDPQSGDLVYRLENVSRLEPTADLFSVPADYKVQEGSPVFIRRNIEKNVEKNK